MTTKTIDSIHRTGNSSSAIRHLVAVIGTGRDRDEQILSTPITKIQWAPEFRGGQNAAPMEQYAFRVGKRVVERFADAAALVIRKHHIKIEMAEEEMAQYVRKAVRMARGDEEIRFLDEVPEGAAEATGPAPTVQVKGNRAAKRAERARMAEGARRMMPVSITCG